MLRAGSDLDDIRAVPGTSERVRALVKGFIAYSLGLGFASASGFSGPRPLTLSSWVPRTWLDREASEGESGFRTWDVM